METHFLYGLWTPRVYIISYFRLIYRGVIYIYIYIWPNGIIFHQPRFPWRGPISLPICCFLGAKSVVWGRGIIWPWQISGWSNPVRSQPLIPKNWWGCDIFFGWRTQNAKPLNAKPAKPYKPLNFPGQIIATSAEVTPKGSLVGESSQNRLNSGLGIIVICPEFSLNLHESKKTFSIKKKSMPNKNLHFRLGWERMTLAQ